MRHDEKKSFVLRIYISRTCDRKQCTLTCSTPLWAVCFSILTNLLFSGYSVEYRQGDARSSSCRIFEIARGNNGPFATATLSSEVRSYIGTSQGINFLLSILSNVILSVVSDWTAHNSSFLRVMQPIRYSFISAFFRLDVITALTFKCFCTTSNLYY
jgi:hypothetical protein